MNRFQLAIRRQNDGRPPVWLMRQAGRYHSHYQKLKERYSFMELCKIPEAALETTMGPIEDFGFDAAILFSDLLFPLEAMGTGLRYDPGPKLDWHLRELSDLDRLKGGGLVEGKELVRGLAFQAEAMKLIRARLPAEKGLLGFVGGPLTLYYYAVEGSHQGELGSAHAGLTDGRYDGFAEKLRTLLVENLFLQARAGADTVAILDTCAGELTPDEFARHGVPELVRVLKAFHAEMPGYPIAYYSKGTDARHWRLLRDLPISYLGVDWKHDITAVIDEFGDQWAIQGNFDPEWMLESRTSLEPKLREFFERVKRLPRAKLRGWVCGLGHGVLQKTPEENVRLFMKLQREYFGWDEGA